MTTTDAATTSANSRLACRFLELVTQHDVERLIELITPDWLMHGGPPGLPRGPEGARRLFATFGPIEQEWTVEDVVAAADRVVLRGTNTCRQDAFLGLPAAGVRQVFTATFVFRVADGLIAEVWRNADDLGRVLQLGARLEAGRGPDGLQARWAAREPVEEVADALVHALEHGDDLALARICHPDLRFTTHADGVVRDRDGVLASFRHTMAQLRDVAVDVVDRQLTDTGFVSQQIVTGTGADGARLRVATCLVVALRAGRIVRVDGYFDRAAIDALHLA